jgi:hypothetical protein
VRARGRGVRRQELPDSAAEQSASASANLSSKIGSRSTNAWAARNCAVIIAVRLAPSMARPFPAGFRGEPNPCAALPVIHEGAGPVKASWLG